MKNIIFISYKIFPLDSGDSLYNYGIVREISKISNLYIYSYVDPLFMNDIESFNKQVNNVRFYVNKKNYSIFLNMFSKIGRVPSVDRDMFNDIVTRIKTQSIDIVFVSHIFTIQYAILLKRQFPNLRLIYISHNAEVCNLIEQDLHNKKYLKRTLIRRIFHYIRFKATLALYKWYEKFLLTSDEVYFTTSLEDAKIHKSMYKISGNSYLCKPLIDFSSSKSLEKLQVFNKRLLIAGTMGWYPNVEAVVWFVDNVMPSLVEEGYILYLVGNGPTEQIYKLKSLYPQNIIITGRVPSMDKYFKDCDISIIPIFSGTGTKIKVLESIGRGIPTVATTFAAKDYNISDEILIADTAEEFINSIRKIETSYDTRKNLFCSMEQYYKNYMELSPEIAKLIVES